MKKKIFYFFIFIFLLIAFYLNLKSTRYTGVNYSVSSEEITNYKKIKDFYQRHNKYKNLVEEILENSKKQNIVIDLSKWVYLNIKKHKPGTVVVDSHPWTIIERKVGTDDQFSDLLSVLLVYKNIDAFYTFNFNTLKHSFTFFKDNGRWSIIDPYYGLYFINEKKEFCSLKEIKLTKCEIVHFKYNRNINYKLEEIFNDKNFNNLIDAYKYYDSLFENLPTDNQIEGTNIYLRGGRSYIQKPFHRLFYQIQKILKII